MQGTGIRKVDGYEILFDEAGFRGRQWTVETGPSAVQGQQYRTLKDAVDACRWQNYLTSRTHAEIERMRAEQAAAK